MSKLWRSILDLNLDDRKSFYIAHQVWLKTSDAIALRNDIDKLNEFSYPELLRQFYYIYENLRTHLPSLHSKLLVSHGDLEDLIADNQNTLTHILQDLTDFSYDRSYLDHLNPNPLTLGMTAVACPKTQNLGPPSLLALALHLELFGARFSRFIKTHLLRNVPSSKGLRYLNGVDQLKIRRFRTLKTVFCDSIRGKKTLAGFLYLMQTLVSLQSFLIREVIESVENEKNYGPSITDLPEWFFLSEKELTERFEPGPS